MKKETISNWMKSDRELDEKYANTEPSEYYCPKCEILLDVKCKDLQTDIDKPARVLFLYSCPKCNYHARYFDDGTKYEKELTLCEKCNHEVKLHPEYDSKSDIATWTNTCPKCQHVSITKHDFKKMSQNRENREKREKEFLDKYRSEYCFSEEEGTKAVILQHGLAEFSKRLSEIKEKEQDPLYQKAKNLKKLKVIEINKLLSEELKKENYQNLIFEKPDIQRFVAVPFIIEDLKEDREGYDSERNLKSAITKILKDTNWRLMSEGVHYRAGYLNGRLRCDE